MQTASSPQELMFHMAPQIVTYHAQPIKAGTQFSDPRGMQGWVDLVGLVTHQGGIHATYPVGY